MANRAQPHMTSPLHHGWLVVDKPLGMTSTQAVSLVRKALKIKKIGHGGTLDPLASGVLPLAVGEATKTVPYIQQDEKTYVFTVTWGELRTTGDAEGDVVETSTKLPTQKEIQDILSRFTGEIEQLPPLYSALKVNGKRSYDLARAGKAVPLPPRTVHVKNLEILEHHPDKTQFKVVCGKGTYVRSLAVDMAYALNTVGYVSFLRRTQVGQFCEKNSIHPKKTLEFTPESGLQKAWYSICEALDDILAITVSAQDAQKLRHGQQVVYPDADCLACQALCISTDKAPVALVSLKEGRLQPERVFNI